MLNIAESIPLPESIPPIPELHPTQFHSIPESLLLIPRDSGIHFNGTCQFHATPELLTDIHTLTFAIRKQFRYAISDPELDGISRNSVQFRNSLPESLLALTLTHGVVTDG
jgi:hypothetical protein